jgi:hypothetical protein
VGARQHQQQEAARAQAFGHWEPPKS